ncbi:MAG: Fe-S cluster assembly protein SufD [Bdellovibrionales bacterium]|nr:Fe-S cluster assembly protein SufD [Bdellovibrionales bacterium]
MSLASSEKTAGKWYLQHSELLKQRESMGDDVASPMHLAEVRSRAQSELRVLGLPSAQSEDWKYTNLRDVENGTFELASRDVVSSVTNENFSTRALPLAESYRIATVDGFVSSEHSDDFQEYPKGVRVCSFAQLQMDSNADLRAIYDRVYTSLSPVSSDAVSALSASYVQDGIVITVARNTTVEVPVYIQHMVSRTSESVASFPRVVVVLEEGAHLQVVEHFAGARDAVAGFITSVAEVVVGKNAEVQYYQIGEDLPQQQRISRIHIRQERDSRAKTFSFTFGGKLVRNEVFPTLAGEGAFTGMYGLSVLKDTQHVDNFTVLDHAVPHCESDERYKGIYDDSSKGVFCGTIIVRPDAQKTNAIQNNQGLLLSDRASLATKPQLKIWADDVKCTHGATVGQLDQDQLFYLRSRGIGQRDARNMLVRAFAGDVTREIPLHDLREYLDDRVVEKLSL